MKKKPKAGPGDTTDNEQLVSVLLKDYELAVSRFDKTDDRIIQLISVGLALIGLVVVLLRQVPGASAGTARTASGSDAFLATSREFVAAPTLATATADMEAVRNCVGACLIFLIGYIGLVHVCALLWKPGKRKKFAVQLPDCLVWASGLKFGTDKQKPDEKEPDEPIIPASVHWTWASGVIIGVLCIIVVGGFIKPTLPPNSGAGAQVPLALLWLAPLSLVVFHALLIYVLYSAFGLLWYCRALSKSINIALNAKQGQAPTGAAAGLTVLRRFDQDSPPSRFFSFGRGNVKPRTNYILLLGSIGFLFLWVTVASFINIYASNWWEGALMLAIYFALEFTVMFALSGVGHDLERSQRTFVDEVAGKIPREPSDPNGSLPHPTPL
ncbi:MAG TPA: hypothetical protein VF914_07185 [Chloroflexia bacterium]|jgi:hypothetical protein